MEARRVVFSLPTTHSGLNGHTQTHFYDLRETGCTLETGTDSTCRAEEMELQVAIRAVHTYMS